MGFLRYQQDDGQSGEVRIDTVTPEIRVGRSQQCQIRTRNSTVSRHHCEIVFADGVITARDLDSSNGMFFKRRRVRRAVLEDGDSLYCGNFRLDFSDQALPDASQEVAFGDEVDAHPDGGGDGLPSLPSFDELARERAYTPKETEFPSSADEIEEDDATLESTEFLADLVEAVDEAPADEPQALPETGEEPHTDELAELRAALGQAEAERDEALERLAGAQQAANDELATSRTAFEEQTTTFQAASEALQAELAQAVAARDEAQVGAEQARAALDHMVPGDTLAALEGDLTAARDEAADAQKAATAAASRMEKLEGQLASAKDESRAAAKASAKEAKRLQKRIHALETSQEKATAKANEQETELAAAQKAVAKAQEDLAAAAKTSDDSGREWREAQARQEQGLADAMEATRKAQEESKTLLAANKRHVKKIAGLIEEAERAGQLAAEGKDTGTVELNAATKEAADAKHEVKNLREDLAQRKKEHAGLAVELETARSEASAAQTEVQSLLAAASNPDAESARPRPGGEDDGFRGQVTALYDDLNDLASEWRNSVRLATDWLAEIEQGITDQAARKAAQSELRGLLEGLQETSNEVKKKLKEFRILVED